MIPKIVGNGKSFAGLGKYLTHDPNALTSERVAWTHTHNLANVFVPAAISEMIWTSRDAEILKQEAGIRGGGRSSKHPVKHVSLNWAPGDNPSEKHMIATAEHFLKHMGWHEHQAIFVAHNDKQYRHVHLIINEVHPETGRCLSSSWEKNRAQTWAAEYELVNGIRCEQRLLPAAERKKAMPRNVRMMFKQNEREFETYEQKLRDNYPNDVREYPSKRDDEWKILKQFQRSEREDFFAQGKTQFKALRADVYRDVKEEFRERWAAYYEARKLDADPQFLKATKAEIVAEQTAYLEPRRDIACQELRNLRDEQYRELLGTQKADREMLAWHQKNGLDTAVYFDSLQTRRGVETDLSASFRETAFEITARGGLEQPETSWTPAHDAVEKAGQLAEGGLRSVGAGAGAFADAILSGFFNLGSARPDPVPYAGERNPFAVAAEEAIKRTQHEQQQKADDECSHRSKVAYGE